MTPPPSVYGSAERQGLRSRLASRLASRARARRHERLFAHAGVGPGARVLDVGCGALGLRALAPELDITGLDLLPDAAYPGPLVVGDPAEGLPFADGEFDLAYCSSVIEHVPRERRPAFAAELRRVARGFYVQTPAWSFPVEPHSLLPFAHWLPPAPRRLYWRLGVSGGWERIDLLRHTELERLFPGGEIHAERAVGLVKSWVAVRPPGR